MSFRARETRYLQKPIFATFDLQYLDSRTRDSMRLLSQLIKCRNKDLYKFVAYYLSFRGLPLYSPYLTGLDQYCADGTTGEWLKGSSVTCRWGSLECHRSLCVGR
jgi:hypothetical protein